jgi:KipI family sensor histidine kinase inhibitor
VSGHPRAVAFGDAGVFVELGGEPGPSTSERVQDLAHRLAVATSAEPGWERPIAAATSVLVPVDPVTPGVPAAISRVQAIMAAGATARPWPGNAPSPEVIEIPVRYGGEDGPDLEIVAAMTGRAASDIIDIHTATTYAALFLGFAPGFAYLGPLDGSLLVPRRDVPREQVPAGSVAIAGPQTAVYSVSSPGGWWILGRTDLRVWDPDREPAALIRPGAHVRFVDAHRRSRASR